MTIDRFAALDVEVASRSPVRVCAIGIARYEGGQEVHAYRSLVHVEGVVRYTRIHGLARSDLAGAPPWPQVWRRALEVLGNVRTVVAFNATFDRGAVLTMSARHGIRLPRLRFVCAAELMQARHGFRGSLASALELLGVPFPGEPHEPLSDARAAAAVVLACLPSFGARDRSE